MSGLRTVVFRVPDLGEAKEWYGKAFSKKPYFDEPFYVGFNIGGFELGLLPYEGTDIVHGNSCTAYWSVDNVEKMLVHLTSIGAVVVEEPADVGDGVMVASVKDPWNNLVGIIFNPFFKIS